MITGDGSTSTLWGGVAHRAAREAGLTMFPPLGHSVAAGLARLQPRARIIVILREPGDRLFSDYLYFNADLDKEKNADGFHNLTLEAVAIWNNCTTFRSVDDCVTDRSVLLSFGIVRLHVGLYAVHLRQWLETFPRPNILVLRTEDYSRNVNHSMLQVYQHLDLAPPSEQDMRLVNSARVLNARRTNLQRMQMLAETRQLLTDFYRPHNERLAVLLGSQRFLWEDT
ncbi:carbohydrate sulfotransferase 15-like [Pollicipes pollicipes]|uniref:carbohydrate sulfotransferase 15-like n=1 Tax=Pollicipes pollicipes TaxID=41117 RepID=UPI001885472B|nr:carbohydrate sulfotransferase 15-like [Pollicipes pollicipes]